MTIEKAWHQALLFVPRKFMKMLNCVDTPKMACDSHRIHTHAHFVGFHVPPEVGLVPAEPINSTLELIWQCEVIGVEFDSSSCFKVVSLFPFPIPGLFT